MVSSQTFDLYEGEKRLLLVFAPSEEDDLFDGQALCLNDYREGFLERDLVLFEIVGRGESRVAGEPLPEVDADSLRRRFGVGRDDFLVVLVDRDGVEKQRWHAPVPPLELFSTVDRLRDQRAGTTEG